ncbi:MAG: hypothetical protein MPJ83_02705 [Gammaproteobacteria bacterium]|nr:hypothetical protein [Gammaproteobacteria bacterium]
MEFTFTLQSALILLGAVVVLAIYLLSRRKYPREDAAARVDRALRANPPFIRSGDDDEDAEPAEAELLETPDFAAMDAAGDGNDGGAPGEFSAQMIEGFERVAQVDYWVKIIGSRDVGREGALAIFHENAGAFTKPRGIHGLKMPDNAWRNLEDEAEGARFGDLVVTIQLADRQGAVSAEEMAAFSQLVSRLSEVTDREFFFMAPVENAIAQARVIADFIAHFDSVSMLRIRPRGEGGFPGEDLHRCALELGMECDRNSYARFKMLGARRVALYTLADGARHGGFDFANMRDFTAREVVFYTKPARNYTPGAVFAEMVSTAKAFAARMEGALEGGEAEWSQIAVDERRAAIEQLAAEMARFGIPAGSEEALKIF